MMKHLVAISLLTLQLAALHADAPAVDSQTEVPVASADSTAPASAVVRDLAFNTQWTISKNQLISPGNNNIDSITVGPNGKLIIATGVTVIVQKLTINNFDFNKIEVQGTGRIIFDNVVVVFPEKTFVIPGSLGNMVFINNCVFK